MNTLTKLRRSVKTKITRASTWVNANRDSDKSVSFIEKRNQLVAYFSQYDTTNRGNWKQLFFGNCRY